MTVLICISKIVIVLSFTYATIHWRSGFLKMQYEVGNPIFSSPFMEKFIMSHLNEINLCHIWSVYIWVCPSLASLYSISLVSVFIPASVTLYLNYNSHTLCIWACTSTLNFFIKIILSFLWHCCIKYFRVNLLSSKYTHIQSNTHPH